MPTFFRMKHIFALIFLLSISFASAAQSPYYYQLKVYHLKGKFQNDLVESYLKDAYLPALHRAGIPHIGVFKPVVVDTAEQLIYVLVPAKKLDQLLKIDELILKDKNYPANAKAYLNTEYDKPAYIRIENILMKAFSGMPQPAMPNLTSAKLQRVYELRSYEAATESLSLNKIGMFNDAEIAIFSQLNFNAVFYAQVIAGSKMPNLMYLTTFNDKADRDLHWKAFGPEYKKISGLPQYQHNVSKNVTLFLYPTDYSDY
jgi:hypothetical protein